MNIYEACPEVENGSFLLYIPHINDRLAHWRGSAPRLPCAKGAVAKRLRDCAVKRLILTTNQRKGTVKDTVRSDDR